MVRKSLLFLFSFSPCLLSNVVEASHQTGTRRFPAAELTEAAPKYNRYYNRYGIWSQLFVPIDLSTQRATKVTASFTCTLLLYPKGNESHCFFHVYFVVVPKGQRKSLLLSRVLCCCTQVVAGDGLTGAGNRQAQNLVHSSKVGFLSPCPINI